MITLQEDPRTIIYCTVPKQAANQRPDELNWAERHLRPEALEAVRHCRVQSDQQPPARGQVRPHADPPVAAAGPPIQRPPGPRQPVPGHPFFPALSKYLIFIISDKKCARFGHCDLGGFLGFLLNNSG